MSDEHQRLGPYHTANSSRQGSTRDRAAWKWIAITALALLALAVVVAAVAVSQLGRSESAQPALEAPTSPREPWSPSDPGPRIFAMDEYGWQDSTARCEPGDSSLVTARTEYALLAICSGEDGLVYRGERIHEGDSIEIGNLSVDGWGFNAINESVHYRVTETELTISSGDNVIADDPFVEYRGNNASNAAPRPSSSVPTRPEFGLPALPGSPGQGRGDPPETGADGGYGRYESYGEYANHFQCTVYSTPTAQCRELIEKYGPEAGN